MHQISGRDVLLTCALAACAPRSRASAACGSATAAACRLLCTWWMPPITTRWTMHAPSCTSCCLSPRFQVPPDSLPSTQHAEDGAKPSSLCRCEILERCKDAASHSGRGLSNQAWGLKTSASCTCAGIPLLVLGNKNDLPGALSTTDLIDRLDLKASTPQQPCMSSLHPRGEDHQLGLCLVHGGCCAGAAGQGGVRVQHLLQESEQHRHHPGLAHQACQVLRRRLGLGSGCRAASFGQGAELAAQSACASSHTRACTFDAVSPGAFLYAMQTLGPGEKCMKFSCPAANSWTIDKCMMKQ